MYRWLYAFGLLFCIAALFAVIIRPERSILDMAIGIASLFGIYMSLKLIDKSIPK